MSKAEKLFEAITDVRDDLVEDALDHRFVRRPPLWQRYGGLVACLAIVLGALTLFRMGLLQGMGGMNGSDSAKNEAAGNSAVGEWPMDSGAANGATSDDAEDGGDDTTDGGGYGTDQMPGDPQWHGGLVLPLTIENGEGLAVSRELHLTTGEMLLVEDVYSITAVEARQVTLLYPVAARVSAYSGVVITADREELEQEILQVEAGLDQLDPSNAMSHVEPDEMTGDGSWIFWTRATVTIPAAETVEVCIRYEKPMTASVEIDLADASLNNDKQRVILDGRELTLPDEGNIILDRN